jgi:uncharacterized membrane protein
MKKIQYIIALAVIAIGNAAYLSYKAYVYKFVDPNGLFSFCDFNSTASCTEVLRHPLSEVFGIPFPWIALVVYPVILTLAILAYKLTSMKLVRAIQILAAMGIVFNGFIIYREVVYIHAYCLLCLMCTGIIISIFALATLALKEKK